MTKNKSNIKIILLNLPLRVSQEIFPPLGPSRIHDSLVSAGYTNITFYNLDLIRPNDSEIEAYFYSEKPDVIGISAVVSTSYLQLKRISTIARKVAPHALQVVGGNMVAAANVLLEKCPIDIGVVGEGEEIIVNLMDHFLTNQSLAKNHTLQEIKGLVYKNNDNKIIFTGYAPTLRPEQIRQMNYALIHSEQLSKYLISIDKIQEFSNDNRTMQPHRKGKRLAFVKASQGCVSRCTFCHRWTKGYQVFDPTDVVQYMKHLKDVHNVGFVYMSDENFGSNRKQTENLLERLKDLDMLWIAGGVRVVTVDEELLKLMHDAGCVAVYFGIESGSDRILSIMEKRATVKDNLAALKAVRAANLKTIIQLVIAMPGETNQTIDETIQFLSLAADIFSDRFPLQLSVNYAQALPGTPLYEYARSLGAIGKTIEDEEKYLIQISDTDAAHLTHFYNLTSSSLADVLTWRDKILIKMWMKSYTTKGQIFTHWKKNLDRGKTLRIIFYRIFGESLYMFGCKVFRCWQYTGGNLKELTKLILVKDKTNQEADIPTESLRKILSSKVVFDKMSEDTLREGR